MHTICQLVQPYRNQNVKCHREVKTDWHHHSYQLGFVDSTTAIPLNPFQLEQWTPTSSCSNRDKWDRKRQNNCVSMYMHDQTENTENTIRRNWIYCHSCLMTTNCVCASVWLCVSLLVRCGKMVEYCEKVASRFAVAGWDGICFRIKRSFWLSLYQPVEMLSKTLLREGTFNEAKCSERHWG